MALSSGHPSSRVWITGIGALTCTGRGADSLWSAAAQARTGITNDGLGKITDKIFESKHQSGVGRALEFSVVAAEEALAQAGWGQLQATDGLILATTTGQIDVWDTHLVDFLRGAVSRDDLAQSFQHQSLGAMLDQLRASLGAPGPSTLVTSACGAATQGLALAKMWLQQGRVKRCLVGGAEVLSSLTVDGFKSLQLLSLEPSRPFDQARKGINLSEAAAFLTLETETKFPLAELAGYGMRTDAHHMTGPHPDGLGAFEAITSALHRARLSPNDISWVHAHGTGSELNDLAEGIALSQIFDQSMPPVTSTKWVHGHALGASGAIESVLCVQALQKQMMLKTGGLENPDPRIKLNHPRETSSYPLNHVLKTTLGFGGINAALIFSKVPGEKT